MTMSSFIEPLVRLYVALFAASWPTDQVGVVAAVGVISVAALALALAARRVTTSITATLGVRERLADAEPADISTLLSQSDPDADGHARPRAPGRTLAAV